MLKRLITDGSRKDGKMVDMKTIDAGLGVASVAGGAIGGTVGEVVATGAGAAEAVVDAVSTAQAEHATALSTAVAAVSALAAATAPALAKLPPTDAKKATAGMSLLETILVDLKSIFGL